MPEIDLKTIITRLYKQVGLIGALIGVGAAIFGAFNIPILPTYYISQSGDLSFDGSVTLYINAIIWLMLCLFLTYFGCRFYLLSKEFDELPKSDQESKKLKFHLIGASIIIGLMIYMILMLLNIVRPAQFFSNVPFGGPEVHLDFSVLFNAIMLYFMIEILHRVGGSFIKFGIELEENG